MTAKSIIFVEDDESTRALYEMLMRKFLPSYIIQVVSTAELARDIIQNSPCDIVVTDVNLEGMSGRQLFEKVQAKHIDSPNFNMPDFIFCSGVKRVLDNIVEKTSEFSYLTFVKPFPLEDLAKAIRSFEK